MLVLDEDAWVKTPWDNLWLFDKLILARRLGYLCGPTCVPVPEPGQYIVRPITNLHGMGRGAEIMLLTKSTNHLLPGYFWSEVFTGRHVSVDYCRGKQILAAEGFRTSTNLWRFDCWLKVNDTYALPLPELANYEYCNVEFIGDKVIEVHLRQNPDFLYNNVVAIPVWDDEVIDPSRKFVVAEDYRRKGFYVNN